MIGQWDVWACGLRSTGMTICWGNAITSTVGTSPFGGLMSEISATYYTLCGIRSVDGSIVCRVASSVSSTSPYQNIVNDKPTGQWYYNLNCESGQCCVLQRLATNAPHFTGVPNTNASMPICWGYTDNGNTNQVAPTYSIPTWSPRVRMTSLSIAHSYSCGIVASGPPSTSLNYDTTNGGSVIYPVASGTAVVWQLGGDVICWSNGWSMYRSTSFKYNGITTVALSSSIGVDLPYCGRGTALPCATVNFAVGG
jgi:hypothetical protein